MTRPADFRSHLIRQLSFIRRSADLYDEGVSDEAIRIATHIRTIFHDTTKSTSLVRYLSLERLMMISSAIGKPEEGLPFYHGFGKAEQLKDGTRKLVPNLDMVIIDHIPVKEWWQQDIWKTWSGQLISRRSLVLACANKDGGAHVDRNIPEDYAALAAPGAGGIYQRRSGELIIDEESTDAHLMCLRQIGEEILKSPWSDFLPGIKVSQ
jgi:hypothetical protein